MPNAEAVSVPRPALLGRLAVVTGAAGGLGEGICRRLSADGASVAVWDVDLDRAEKLAASLRGAGGNALAHQVDVCNEQSVEVAFDALGTAPAVLVNCAGVAPLGPFLALTDEAWTRCINVNVRGAVLVTRGFLRRCTSTHASIVNVASVAALVGIPGTSAYAASKGALLALTRALSVELAPEVRVNAVCPGTVATPLSRPLLLARGDGDEARGVDLTAARIPLARLCRVEDVAASVSFLVSPDAAFVTGIALPVDGGLVTS